MKKAIRTEDSVWFRGGHDYIEPMHAFLLKNGRFWEPQAFPPAFEMSEKRVPGYVFANATMLAVENDELRYAEGLAYSFESGTDQLRHHAWCVDANDRVVDPTWGIGIAYFGVVMQLSLACRMTGKVPNALQLTSAV
jgi:hypothetical protein